MMQRPFLGWRDVFFACFLVASCSSGDDGTTAGAQQGERGAAGETGAQGPKGDKGDKGDSTFVSVKEVFGNRAGALPLSGPLKTNGGTLILTVSGSGYRSLPGAGTLGFVITIDGTPVGAFNGFTNESGTHRAIPARTLVIPDLIAGDHEIRLSEQPETSTDGNDYFNLTALELGK